MRPFSAEAEERARPGVSRPRARASPSAPPGGHRDYPQVAVDRVIRIQELFAAGLHSGRIAQLLPCTRDTVRSRDTLDEVIEAAREP